MHTNTRKDVWNTKNLIDKSAADKYIEAIENLNLHIESRKKSIPVICEVIGGKTLDLIIVTSDEHKVYTLQALRPLVEGEKIGLRPRGSSNIIHVSPFNCRKGVREGDHPDLYLANLNIIHGNF